MSTLAPSTTELTARLDRDAPAVEVRDLRKTFRRRDRKASRFARKRPWPALADITFTIAESDLKQAVPLVRHAAETVGAKDVKASGGLAKLSIVGTGMLGTPGVAGRMFRTLAEGGINIEGISTSEIRITCLVSNAQAEAGVRALHTAFELDSLITRGKR